MEQCDCSFSKYFFALILPTALMALCPPEELKAFDEAITAFEGNWIIEPRLELTETLSNCFREFKSHEMKIPAAGSSHHTVVPKEKEAAAIFKERLGTAASFMRHMQSRSAPPLYVSRMRRIIAAISGSYKLLDTFYRVDDVCRKRSFTSSNFGYDVEKLATSKKGKSGADKLEEALATAFALLKEERVLCGERDGTAVIMRAVLNRAGQHTGAWAADSTVVDWIYQTMNRNVHYTAFRQLLNASANVNKVAAFLSQTNDPDFPRFKPSRYLCSFENGIYNLQENEFTLYEQIDELPQTFHFIPEVFNPLWTSSSLDDLPVQDFLDILQFQGLNKDDCNAFCALLGRALFEAKLFDSFECIPCLVGASRTGKSTIGEAWMAMYPKDAMCLITKATEKRWVNAMLTKCPAFMCWEMEDGIITESLLKSVASHESTVKEAKYKNVEGNVRFLCQGLLCGQKIPFVDQQGDIILRLIVVDFNHIVAEADRDVNKKDAVLKRIGPLMVRFVRCYFAMMERARYMDRCDIWKLVTPYFMAKRQQYLMICNPICAFVQTLLENGYIKNQEAACCVREETFAAMLRTHLGKKKHFNRKEYSDVLAWIGLTIVDHVPIITGIMGVSRVKYTCSVVHGICRDQKRKVSDTYSNETVELDVEHIAHSVYLDKIKKLYPGPASVEPLPLLEVDE